MGIFDDLNINSEFSWNSEDGTAADEYPVNNEIDIIGTKDLRTYFISAKMTVPETAHLMEIKYFADHFGIDGQAVLVTSNSRTADDSAARPVSKEERSRMMGVRYINRTVIDEGRLGDCDKRNCRRKEGKCMIWGICFGLALVFLAAGTAVFLIRRQHGKSEVRYLGAGVFLACIAICFPVMCLTEQPGFAFAVSVSHSIRMFVVDTGAVTDILDALPQKSWGCCFIHIGCGLSALSAGAYVHTDHSTAVFFKFL